MSKATLADAMAEVRSPKTVRKNRPGFDRMLGERCDYWQECLAMARMLLVEDYCDTARALERLLTCRGHRVAIAHTLAEAVALTQHEQFDLLLMDVWLPDGDGRSLIRRLGYVGARRAITISASLEVAAPQEVAASGAFCHLAKPFEVSTLLEAIDAALPVSSAGASQKL